MTERENILGRVREALKASAPLPGHAQAGNHGARLDPRPWLPPGGETFDARAALFLKHTVELKAEFHLLESFEQAAPLLLKLRDTEAWKSIASHDGELTNKACQLLAPLPVCWTDRPYAAAVLEQCAVGLTECDALVAQTGSVLVTSRSAGGRALSVLPPHHVVLARRQQLISDLPEAFTLLKTKYQDNYPSFISLITGPSRTGDIERVLVLGAHGPKKLTIFCF